MRMICFAESGGPAWISSRGLAGGDAPTAMVSRRSGRWKCSTPTLLRKLFIVCITLLRKLLLYASTTALTLENFQQEYSERMLVEQLRKYERMEEEEDAEVAQFVQARNAVRLREMTEHLKEWSDGGGIYTGTNFQESAPQYLSYKSSRICARPYRIDLMARLRGRLSLRVILSVRVTQTITAPLSSGGLGEHKTKLFPRLSYFCRRPTTSLHR
jgi:hypothetical protein